MRPEPLLLSPLLLTNIDLSRPSVFKRTLDLRQSCPSGEKKCGQYCIDTSDSCCPDKSGGCPSGEYCSLGDNGEYGCCPNNKICGGNGGVTTTGTDYYTSTYTDYSSSTHSSNPASATALNCDSYTLTAASDGAKYSIWCDKNYRGADDLSNIIQWKDGIDTMQKCVNLCERTTGCIATDLYVEAYPGFPAGRCFLLSDISPGYNNKIGVKAASSVSGLAASSSDDSASSSTSLSAPTLSPLPSITPLSSSTSAAVATSTATAASIAAGHLSRSYERANGLTWLASSTATAVTVFLTMVWL